MSKSPYFDKNGMRKGPWSEDEDNKLRAYIERYGHWNWREIPKFAGVSRCGKSCRLRWMNYLRPNMKHGNFTKEEEDVIVELHDKIGNKWSTIAAKLPGRSDNEIKNYWNTHLRKQTKQDHNVLENVHESRGNYPKENPVKNSESEVRKEDDISWATSSAESSSVNIYGYHHVPQSLTSPSTSSYSSGVELSSLICNGSGCSALNTESVQPYGYDYVGNFWTEPFVADCESTRSNEYSSRSDIVDGFISQASYDMANNDEFLWSTMDSYSQYHNQLIK